MKFRAWDKENNEMLYPDDTDKILFEINEYGITTYDVRYLDEYGSFAAELDSVVMQSTGLKDTNGKEIFEGHIVKDTDGYVGYIAFLKQEMGYVVVYKTYDKRLGHRYRLEDGRLEILGNIYQDKHLLGED